MIHKILMTGLFLIGLSAFTADNELSEIEKKEGWEVLFNGKDMSQWRNFKKESLSKKWLIKDGVMHKTKGGGDVLTKEKFTNFELKIDWKISEGGNSGIFIMADETGKYIFSHAPEIQILDNEKHNDRKKENHRSGSLYDMISSPKEAQKPAGEWNTIYLKILNKKLLVKQNGIKVCEVLIEGEKWNEALAKSKFKNWKGFAKNFTGHIGLQEHGNDVFFKNIKIRKL